MTSDNNPVRWLRGALVALPYLIVTIVVVRTFQAVRAACEGLFIYSLDDPYIHLALAEQLARGWYGIEPGTASAPASSILWPFLLAPFAGSGLFEYIPLIFSFAAALGTIFTVGRVFDLALRQGGLTPSLPLLFLRGAAQLLMTVGCNLIGLVFMGMEHNLHVWMCALLVLALATALLENRLPRWFVPVVVLSVLVRYESLAVALPVLLLVFARGFRKQAIAGAAGIALALGGFSAFLLTLGLDPLPSSVLAKARFGISELDSRSSLLWNVLQNLRHPLGLYFLGIGAFLIFNTLLLSAHWVATRKISSERLAFSAAGAAVASLHFCFGQFGWGGRYEPYALLALLLLFILALRDAIAALLRRSVLIPLLMLSLLLAPPLQLYLDWLQDTPGASANIYQQQYQMHRFVVEYLRAPVAVNDLGWVSFENPYPVLDLWGLGSHEALRQREAMARGSIGPEWMDALAHKNGVRLAMIYDTWLPHPGGWQRVARLHLGGRQIAAGEPVVTFYSVDTAGTFALLELLREFQPTLPAGVRLEID